MGLLHGDISQMERNEIISSFKKKEFPILVATDVAGRISEPSWLDYFVDTYLPQPSCGPENH